MKKIILFSLFVFNGLNSFSQTDGKKPDTESKTKTEIFTSKTGSISKFVDYNLTSIKSSYDVSNVRIRKITVGTESLFCYQIIKEGKYSNNTASITYPDLLEITKAFAKLKSSLESDIATNPDYLENKFISEDGFQLGYYVKGSKSTWYVKLDRYGSDNTIYLNTPEIIETSLNEGKAKIEELKK